MNESKLVLEEENQNFLAGQTMNDETFLMWKQELQKELPSFWESMRE